MEWKLEVEMETEMGDLLACLGCSKICMVLAFHSYASWSSPCLHVFIACLASLVLFPVLHHP